MKKSFVIATIALLTILLSGCTNPIQDIIDPPVTGGKVDRTDYKAPKVIKSKDLNYYSGQFYLSARYSYENDGFYDFEVKEDETGSIIITESRTYDVSCESDHHIFEELQKIFEKYDLAKMNGIDEHTAGLPPEYQPCYFRAGYTSGESIYFSCNNDPYDPCDREILELLGDEFAAHGEMCFQPPESAAEVTRFELEYTDGEMRYRYGELQMPKEGVEKDFEDLVTNGYADDEYYVVIEKDPWDRSKKTDPETIYREVTPEYYEGLQQLLKDVHIINFANDEQYPWEFDYEGTPDYYNFYIEYAYGNNLYGFSDDTDQNMAFAPVAKKIAKYIEKYIEEDMHTR